MTHKPACKAVAGHIARVGDTPAKGVEYMSDDMGYPVLPLEKRPIQNDIGGKYTQTSADGGVLWEYDPSVRGYSFVDQHGMRHTYTHTDTQRLFRFLASFQDDIDRLAAVEQQHLDAGAIR